MHVILGNVDVKKIYHLKYVYKIVKNLLQTLFIKPYSAKGSRCNQKIG